MFKRCACPVSLTCIHTQHQCDVFCLQSKHFRSIAGMIAPPAKIYARDRSRSRWNMKHFRQTANRTRLLAAPVLPVDLACSRRRHCSLTRDSHQPVMTGHNARRPRTGRERRPWWPLSEASYLTVWTLNDRFFASRVHCMLRRVLSEYWRKETEKSKVFCGVVGLDGRCSAQAEQRKKPVAVVHLPGAYLSTETNLVPIRGVMKKEFDTGHTRRHARTHTHGIKAVWTARAPALARTWPPARIKAVWTARAPALARTWPPARMKIASLGLAGGRWYDRNSLRTPTMQESQLLREKTTSSVFLSTCSNAVHAQFHWHAYTRNTRPCDVVCLQSKHFRSIAGMIAPPARRSTSTCAIDRDRGETWNTSGKPHAVACCTSRSTASTGSRSTGMQ